MINPGSGGPTSAYTGTRASYVALSAISVLALALMCSIWTSEVSGSIAVLGLMAIYLACQELLVLFMFFCVASIVIDMIRLGATPKDIHGRGWLVFLQLLSMAAKVAGAVFAWSLHKSVASGDTNTGYPAYAAPPPGPAMGSMYQRVEDPFQTAYAPPRHDATPATAPHMSNSSHGAQQQQQQQQHPAPRSPAAAVPQPAAPHHELV